LSRVSTEKLTIYIGTRNNRGEVNGLLIDDQRDPQHPVTLVAERGAFADAGGSSRIIMVNGNRQQYDRDSGKLNVLTFTRYVLDLDSMHDASEGHSREPQERFLGELLFPPADLDPAVRYSYLIEFNQRLTVPLTVFSFAMIPLACLLPGEFNRRGQLKRILLAISSALAFQTIDLAIKNLAGRFPIAIALSYVVDVLPFTLGVGILLRRGIRFKFWRLPMTAAVAR
jgi:lipopolysaccharide export system permease protein